MDLFQQEAQEIALRPHQVKAVDMIKRALSSRDIDGRKVRRVILGACTSFGKTITAAHILKSTAENGKKAMFIADRVKLINQTIAAMDRYGIDCGVQQAQHERCRPWAPVQIASVQTLMRRTRLPDASVFVIDECHSHFAYITELMERLDNCIFIGMSATVLNDLNKFTTVKPRLLNPHPLFDNFGAIISKKEARDRLDLNLDKKYILFFGIVRDYKGLDLLLEAFQDTRIKKLDLNLIIAGEFYSNSDKYISQIKQLDLRDNIIHHAKFIKDEEVVNYFCAADLIVQPYKHATQSGITQIAFHYNKPMIVTNVGGLSEIVPHKKVGYVVDTCPEKIAAAIDDFYVLQNEKEFVENIVEHKKEFSWEKFVKSISEIKKEL